MVSVDMVMFRNRSEVERLGAPLAETLWGERWSSRRGRFQSSLQFGVGEVEDGRSAQACCTFLLAREAGKMFVESNRNAAELRPLLQR